MFFKSILKLFYINFKHPHWVTKKKVTQITT